MLSHRARPRRGTGRQTGVTLLEVLIAILIFSMGILGIMGLQAASIRNTTEAKYRNEAAYLANQIIGTMWGDIANLANYDTAGGAAPMMLAWRTHVADTLPGVTAGSTRSPTITVNGNRVTITVFWKLPGGDAPERQFSVTAEVRPS